MSESRNLKSLSDDELMANAATELGTSAFHELFNRYFTPLTLFAIRFLSDEDAATDVVQNVFIALYEQRLSNAPQNVRSFLYASVRNSCLNVLKHEKIKRRFEQEAVFLADDMSSEATDHLIEESEAQAKVAAAMAQLPDQCRKIFTMNRFDGFSNQEIADQLGLSKRTVETQISNALKILRRLLLTLAAFVIFLF